MSVKRKLSHSYPENRPVSGRVRLPPLNALKVFHAVVRHRSLVKAAEELLVSPQAVGQQIRQLEEAIDVKLVEREGRSIRLTDKAIALSYHVRAGFDEFEEGIRRITTVEDRPSINFNVSPYFGTRYLMPRLADFRKAVPDAEIVLTTLIDLVDLERDEIDIAVQWGYGDRAGVQSRLLMRDPKVICCRPDMAEKIHEPADLLKVGLLQPSRSRRLWPDILNHLGVQVPKLDRDIAFDDAATMRRAAQQGLGVGLISRIDAEEDIDAGRLVAPLGLDVLDGMAEESIPGFYVMSTKPRLRVKPVAELYRWLLDQQW